MKIPLLALGLAVIGSPWIAPAQASAASHPFACARANVGRAVCEPAASGAWTLVGQRFLRGYNEPQAGYGGEPQSPGDE
ncbi:MAG: hypothetical protein JO047_08200, partial [Alphaproteobacteria bacterium]|nr:hypothetical protein [Alphaproteobacteria bacterium]